MKKMKKLFLGSLLIISLMMITACTGTDKKDDGVIEDAGEDIQNGVDDVKDAVDDTVDDATDDTVNDVDETTTGDKLGDTINDNNGDALDKNNDTSNDKSGTMNEDTNNNTTTE